MDFSAFDTSKIEAYIKQAKEQWENTPEFKAYEEKAINRTKEEEVMFANDMMKLFVTFGEMKMLEADCDAVQNQVKKITRLYNQ